jgi:hypothetical protein
VIVGETELASVRLGETYVVDTRCSITSKAGGPEPQGRDPHHSVTEPALFRTRRSSQDPFAGDSEHGRESR